ncbi:hypothetical protein EJ110_NYTH43559, partial [Nymphaea thermarum]
SLPPPKPWERGSNLSGPTPFKPSAPGKTSDVVEASGTAKPGEVVTSTESSNTVSRDAVGRPLPTRPWQQNYGNSYGGYNSGMNYNSNYGSGMYGSYGGYGGGLYGGGLYGNSMYRGYGSPYGGSGPLGGGMYNSGFGGPMGGYGTGIGGPFGQQDPNDPFGPPSSPPGFWVSFLRVVSKLNPIHCISAFHHDHHHHHHQSLFQHVTCTYVHSASDWTTG